MLPRIGHGAAAGFFQVAGRNEVQELPLGYIHLLVGVAKRDGAQDVIGPAMFCVSRRRIGQQSCRRPPRLARFPLSNSAKA